MCESIVYVYKCVRVQMCVLMYGHLYVCVLHAPPSPCVCKQLSDPAICGSVVNNPTNRRGLVQSISLIHRGRYKDPSCKNQSVERKELSGTVEGRWKTWVCAVREILTCLVEVSREMKDQTLPESKTLFKDCTMPDRSSHDAFKIHWAQM